MDRNGKEGEDSPTKQKSIWSEGIKEGKQKPCLGLRGDSVDYERPEGVE